MLRYVLATSVAAVAVLALVPTYAADAGASSPRPNIVVILTDDQDSLLGSTAFQPTVLARLVGEGMNFTRAFANAPVCCPSRSSLLSGRFTHNHGAVNNSLAGGCASQSWIHGVEADALAVHMAAANYSSLYAGKYLNQYGLHGDTHIPKGWTEWFGLHGNSRYYNYSIQNNHRVEKHGDSYKEDYLTDVLKRRALQFVQHQNASQPFMMWVATPAAHASFTPAPQYEGTAAGQKAPRTPTWNKVYADRHETVRQLSPMSDKDIAQSDTIFAQRLGTLRSVDDLVREVLDQLETQGLLNNTFVFYTGDHGFHLGQLAMGYDKRQLYETDTRVPFFVRGPGVVAGSIRNEPISHVDLAATIVDLATGAVPPQFDGASYKSLLLDPTADAKGGGNSVWVRRDTMLQYFGEGDSVESCGANMNHYQPDGDTCLRVGAYDPAPCDGVNNTYTCVRTATPDLSVDEVYCEFNCFGPHRVPVPCPSDQAEGYGEAYDMRSDPWQTTNIAKTMSPAKVAYYAGRIADMRNCKGQAECQAPAPPPPVEA